MKDHMKTRVPTYRIADGILCQELDRESVVLNLGTEQYFSLDPVGTRIWKLLAETRSIDATVRTMLSEYEIDEAALRQDVEELVRKLIAKGLLIEDAGTGNDAAA